MFFMLWFPLMLGNLLLGLAGLGAIEEGLTESLFWWGWPVWVPLGLGMAARYNSSDSLKPSDYPETPPGQRRVV